MPFLLEILFSHLGLIKRKEGFEVLGVHIVLIEDPSFVPSAHIFTWSYNCV